jgi:hypothetical protein
MVPWEMVAYATYAEKFGWTPQQVDQLTIEQDDWIMPILHAVDAEREYKQQKAAEAAERKAKAKQARRSL